MSLLGQYFDQRSVTRRCYCSRQFPLLLHTEDVMSTCNNVTDGLSCLIKEVYKLSWLWTKSANAPLNLELNSNCNISFLSLEYTLAYISGSNRIFQEKHLSTYKIISKNTTTLKHPNILQPLRKSQKTVVFIAAIITIATTKKRKIFWSHNNGYDQHNGHHPYESSCSCHAATSDTAAAMTVHNAYGFRDFQNFFEWDILE